MKTRIISQLVAAEYEKYKQDVFSQRGEDGVIKYFLEKMGISKGYFVEFGAWDGKHLSNSANLAMQGWSGCFIEGDSERYLDLLQNYGSNDNVAKINCFITPEGESSLGAVLNKVSAPDEFDVLSIDIDGKDYLIWESLVTHCARLVVIEYNPTIPANVVVIQESQDDFSFGNSLAALWQLGLRKGYRLVGTTDWNAFFIRDQDCKKFNITNYLPWNIKDTKFETSFFHGFNGQIKLAGNKILLWHGVAIEESKVQMLPNDLQKFPDGHDTEYLQALSHFRDKCPVSTSKEVRSNDYPLWYLTKTMIKKFEMNKVSSFFRKRWLIFTAMLRVASSDEVHVLKSSSADRVLFIKRKAAEPNLSVGTLNAPTRDAWIESTLKSLPKGTKLLDAGAGEMQYKKFCEHLHYVSQDLAAYDGSGNDVGLQTGRWNTTGIDIVSDICSMPLEGASFDAVLCSEVLEHLTDPVKALKELTRVLRSGGKIILTAPFCSLTHFAPYHYGTGFNKYFYLHHLKELGYCDIDITENGNYFEFMAQELRRVQSMAEKYAGSKLTVDGEFAISTLLTKLQEFSDRDVGSSEMLHFDCQVTATKK